VVSSLSILYAHILCKCIPRCTTSPSASWLEYGLLHDEGWDGHYLEEDEDVVVDVLLVGAVELEGSRVHLGRLIGNQAAEILMRVEAESARCM
jgi:hypothetical protein